MSELITKLLKISEVSTGHLKGGNSSALSPSTIPVGIVFRQNLANVLKRHQIIENNEMSVGRARIPVYFDVNQKDDCLVFQDAKLLKSYLCRNQPSSP